MVRYINMGLLVLLFQTISMAGPTAKELLDKFTETVDKTHTSFITKSKIKIVSNNKHSGEWAYLSGKKTAYQLRDFRTDGERIKSIRQRWGDFIGSDGKLHFRPESEKDYGSDTYNGEKGYDYAALHNSPVRLTIIRKGPEKAFPINIMLAYSNHVSECFGYLEGDIERFDRILKKARTRRISVRDKMEDLNGTAHYVIDAKTRNGQYTIWLNPEKGYNFSKAVVVREPGDLYMGRSKVDRECQKNYIIENTKFTDVNGVWVPVEAKMRIHDTLPGGDYVKFTKDVELTSILIDPDHDALDSFSIDDIKDGVRVLFRGGPPGKYIWRDGKAVAYVDKLVIAELDKMAEEIMAEANSVGTQEDPNTQTTIEAQSTGSASALPVIELEDLLKNYAQTMSYFKNFSEEAETIISQAVNDKSRSRQKESLEFKTDGTRAVLKTYSWENAKGSHVNYDKEQADYQSILWKGQSLTKYRLDNGDAEGTTSTVRTHNGFEAVIKEHPDSALLGFFPKEDKRIDFILAKCDKVLVQADTDTVNGSECYVVLAVTKREKKFRIWFDPAHGYNIVRAQSLSGTPEKGFSFILSAVHLENIDGVWVPMQAKTEETRTFKGRSKSAKCNYKRTKVVLNPVFNENDFASDSMQ